MKRTRTGFTLVELLVVIGIIALLVGILLPALNKARRSANSAKCLSNLRQIGQAFQMYLSTYKGTIVQPVEYDPNYNPTTVMWHQRLSVFFNKKDVRSGSEDASQLSMVLRGCPEWTPIDNDANGKPDSDKIGYGMCRKLRTPESQTRYHAPADPTHPTTPTGINGPVDTDQSNPPAGTVYYAPYWKITQIKKASSRIIFGDSRNHLLDPSSATGWDLSIGLNLAVSGDIGRHSANRWVTSTSDARYKTMRANYCFVDGHCENLTPDDALQGINNPR